MSRICHVVELVVSCIYNVVQLVVLNMSCGSASCFACINVYISCWLHCAYVAFG